MNDLNEETLVQSFIEPLRFEYVTPSLLFDIFSVTDDSSEDSSIPPSRNRNNSAMASKAKRRQSLDPRAMKALNKAKTTAATKG